MLFSETILAKLRRNEPSYGKEIDLAGKLDDLQQGKIEALVAAAAGINQVMVFSFDVTTGAATGLEIFLANAPFKFEVIDVIIQPRGASVNGTIKITDGTNDITNAMVCAVDKTMVKAASIDDAYSTIAKDGTLDIVCAGDTIGSTIALVTVLVIAR